MGVLSSLMKGGAKDFHKVNAQNNNPEPMSTPAATVEVDKGVTESRPKDICRESKLHDIISIDATYPVDIIEPLEIGKDTSELGGDNRMCLMARQGASEIQEKGEGVATYCFYVHKDDLYTPRFRVRWVDDGVGSSHCNNSWFARIDDGEAFTVGNDFVLTNWSWEYGKQIRLTKGLHWLRIELREDGVRMGKIIFECNYDRRDIKQIASVAYLPSEGSSSPYSPQDVMQPIGLYAIQNGSRVVGAGHENKILLGASLNSTTIQEKELTYEISNQKEQLLKVNLNGTIKLSQESPVVRLNIPLECKKNITRKNYIVVLRVKDKDGHVLFVKRFTFTVPFAWAFISRPLLQEDINSHEIVYKGSEENPGLFASMVSPEKLKVGSTTFDKEWKLTEDGHCYSWNGAVDLHKVFGKSINRTAYAVTWLSAEMKLLHRSFFFGADDNGWLWMNNKYIANLSISLPLEANRMFVSGEMRRGSNRVVIKIAQLERYWRFRLDVIDWHYQGRRGDSISGIELKKWVVKKSVPATLIDEL